MALDVTLLEFAEKSGIPVMRTYTWKPFTISLGYHQKAESIDRQKCREEHIELVRRPTGGRAVLHAQELTYSIVIPRSSRYYQENLTRMYFELSTGLARGLRLLGVEASLEKRTLDLRSHYETDLSVSCFSAAARNEILVQGRKLVGSAQRHLHQGLLQHGSILSGPAHLELPRFLAGTSKEDQERLKRIIEAKTVCLEDLLSGPPRLDELSSLLRRGMEEALGISFSDSEITPEEEGRAARLRDDFTIPLRSGNKEDNAVPMRVARNG